MPAPRRKMVNRGSKAPPSVPKPVPQVDNNNPDAADEDAERKLEEEVTWCVQQLEVELQGKSGKGVSQKKAEVLNRYISILNDKNVRLVKKRQLMNTLYGDYRSKMASEADKVELAIKKMTITPVEPHAYSLYIQKTAKSSGSTTAAVTVNAALPVDAAKLPKPDAPPSFHFESSDNSFRFGFTGAGSGAVEPSQVIVPPDPIQNGMSKLTLEDDTKATTVKASNGKATSSSSNKRKKGKHRGGKGGR